MFYVGKLHQFRRRFRSQFAPTPKSNLSHVKPLFTLTDGSGTFSRGILTRLKLSPERFEVSVSIVLCARRASGSFLRSVPYVDPGND